jgi:hypothetical protein
MEKMMINQWISDKPAAKSTACQDEFQNGRFYAASMTRNSPCQMHGEKVASCF